MVAIAAQLAAANTALHAYPERPYQILTPAAYVSLPEVDYHGAFAHGRMDIYPTITVLVSNVVDTIGEPTLAGYMDASGATSIHAAIEADKTLGLSANGVNCIVVKSREVDTDLGGIRWFGAVFELRVTATGGA